MKKEELDIQIEGHVLCFLISRYDPLYNLSLQKAHSISCLTEE